MVAGWHRQHFGFKAAPTTSMQPSHANSAPSSPAPGTQTSYIAPPSAQRLPSTILRRDSATISRSLRSYSSDLAKRMGNGSQATPSADGTVKITFGKSGVQPPVFVATSFTDHPWEPQEMKVVEDHTTSDDLIFEKTYNDVPEGEHQYKFRLGHGDWWVVDDNAETVTDDAGNCNNSMVVSASTRIPNHPVAESDDVWAGFKSEDAPDDKQESAVLSQPATSTTATTNGKTEDTQSSAKKVDEKDETAPAATPFIVVEKAPEQEQPAYGDTEGGQLEEDATLRKHDSEPDAIYEPEQVEVKHAAEPTSAGSPIPTVVVEKTDDRLEHGDDFGKDATAGQQQAHEQRQADAEPDELKVSGDVQNPAIDEKKESHDDDRSAFATALGYIPPAGMTPAHERAPLLAHESSFHSGHTSYNADDDDDHETRTPLLRHETIAEKPAEEEEVEDGPPLFRHETIGAKDDNEDEDKQEDAVEETDFQPTLDKAGTPLFRHESIYSKDHAAEVSRFSTAGPSRTDTFNPSRSSTMGVEDGDDEDDDDDDDEIDEDDPTLERFPTEREEIYKQISRSSTSLPVDEPMSPAEQALDAPESPAHIRPIPSTRSSAQDVTTPMDPIVEDEAAEEEEMEALPSPIGPLGAVPEEDVARGGHAESSSDKNADVSVPVKALLTPPATPMDLLRDRHDSIVDSAVEDEIAVKPDRATTKPKEAEEVNQAQHIEQSNADAIPVKQPESKEQPEERSKAEPTTESTSQGPRQREPTSLMYHLWYVLVGSWLGPLAQGNGVTMGVALALAVAVAGAAFYFGPGGPKVSDGTSK